MSNQVYANGMEISCKESTGKTICAFPDVCFTPPQTPATPPGVPLPYPNTGMSSDTTDGSKSVLISGQEIMLKNKSYFKKSTGDEAGCAPKKGFVNSSIQGKVYFTAWSMDVQIEGENAVRNLDQTTGNHACPNSNESAPWPFIAGEAIAPNGACHSAVTAMKDHCSSPTDTSDSCCAVPQRQCVMVPKRSDKSCCCPNHGTTGHHAIPKQEMCEEGSAGKRPLKGNEGYKHEDAPCVCAEGGSPGKRDGDGMVGSHGLFHNAYKQGRTLHLEQSQPWDYPSAKTVAAQSVSKETQCPVDCIEKQIAVYHDSRIKVVRVSKQYEFVDDV
ncbi:PAAR-like domain-containing protein [Caballeronia telluris]|uniref:Tox-GHH2 domain-containing protein n=1 Tax=Caballeronia telluris TaxID=326475 RepID=A0A158FVS7_9BURK|nr:PAAR-like domain-containing protein [Caballeronia telluris]SAL23733.1 hypothetical protein AWB66_01280 [Caballeronia telluris]